MNMSDRAAELRGIANASGFLLQMRIADEVESTNEQHKWEVLAKEQPWAEKESGKEGYIDLVLGRDRVRIVIE